jgi:Lrp/AsnC family transcriptional regulator, regulator for asnA, asnC and gidA
MSAGPASHGVDGRPVDIDPIDKELIRLLQRDGRTPYSRLGPAVGLSQAAARQRVQRLVDRGVMQVVAVTDPVLLGFDVQALVAIEVTGDVRKVADALSAWDEVEYLVITAGRYDLFVEVVCADNAHLLELVNDRIRSVEGVLGSEIFTYLHLVKQTYSWGAR